MHKPTKGDVRKFRETGLFMMGLTPDRVERTPAGRAAEKNEATKDVYELDCGDNLARITVEAIPFSLIPKTESQSESQPVAQAAD